MSVTIFHMSDSMTAVASTQSASAHWKYYDNNCSRWQLISLPVNGLGCCRLRLAFTFQTLLPYVSDTFYNGYLSSHKQLDGGSWNFFHTNIGVNEVTAERIIKRHLTMKLNWCFRRWARLKALTCQSISSDRYLPATHRPTPPDTHTDTHLTGQHTHKPKDLDLLVIIWLELEPY